MISSRKGEKKFDGFVALNIPFLEAPPVHPMRRDIGPEDKTVLIA